jgi:catechol 2,3-dioxygenase
LSLARNFYHDALGLDAIVWSYPGAVFLSAGGYHHHLGANTWSATAPTASERDARLLEWTMVLPEQRDVRRAGLSLKNAGYDVEMAGEDRLIVDPWGTVLRLSTGT